MVEGAMKRRGTEVGMTTSRNGFSPTSIRSSKSFERSG